jgi:hypothetical protein
MNLALINATKGWIDSEVPILAEEQDLGFDFRRGDSVMLVVTEAQAQAYEKAIKHQGRANYKFAYYDNLAGYLAVEFRHIMLGIETDGYTHS